MCVHHSDQFLGHPDLVVASVGDAVCADDGLGAPLRNGGSIAYPCHHGNAAVVGLIGDHQRIGCRKGAVAPCKDYIGGIRSCRGLVVHNRIGKTPGVFQSGTVNVDIVVCDGSPVLSAGMGYNRFRGFQDCSAHIAYFRELRCQGIILTLHRCCCKGRPSRLPGGSGTEDVVRILPVCRKSRAASIFVSIDPRPLTAQRIGGVDNALQYRGELFAAIVGGERVFRLHDIVRAFHLRTAVTFADHRGIGIAVNTDRRDGIPVSRRISIVVVNPVELDRHLGDRLRLLINRLTINVIQRGIETSDGHPVAANLEASVGIHLLQIPDQHRAEPIGYDPGIHDLEKDAEKLDPLPITRWKKDGILGIISQLDGPVDVSNRRSPGKSKGSPLPKLLLGRIGTVTGIAGRQFSKPQVIKRRRLMAEPDVHAVKP